MGIVNKSKIKEIVNTLQGENQEVSSVADEVGIRLERVVEEILNKAIKRAKENKRRTLQARDL